MQYHALTKRGRVRQESKVTKCTSSADTLHRHFRRYDPECGERLPVILRLRVNNIHAPRARGPPPFSSIDSQVYHVQHTASALRSQSSEVIIAFIAALQDCTCRFAEQMRLEGQNQEGPTATICHACTTATAHRPALTWRGTQTGHVC